jgi:hypothetical protein
MAKLDVNEKVTVTELGFRKNLAVYPRRMEFRGNTYSFIDSGILCLVKCGERVAQMLTMSDGKADYFLRSDNRGNDWTLVSICS